MLCESQRSSFPDTVLLKDTNDRLSMNPLDSSQSLPSCQNLVECTLFLFSMLSCSGQVIPLVLPGFLTLLLALSTFSVGSVVSAPSLQADSPQGAAAVSLASHFSPWSFHPMTSKMTQMPMTSRSALPARPLLTQFSMSNVPSTLDVTETPQKPELPKINDHFPHTPSPLQCS